MPQEYIFSDFSGGMNPSLAVDKLPDNQLLQASNVRLDESGNANSAFGSTLLSSSTDSSGNKNVHSVYFDAQIGAVVGIGKDVFDGAGLGSLTDALGGTNAGQSKMSFGVGPGRIFFDVNGTPMFFDPTLTTPLAIDWAPPSAGAGGSTLKTSGTGGTVSRSANVWTNATNVTGTTGFATVVLSTGSPNSDFLKANGFGFGLSTSTLQGIQVTCNAKLSGVESTGYVTVTATLLRNGVSVGQSRFATIFQNTTLQLPFGNSTDLWGSGLLAADLNAATFGVLISATLSANAIVSPITLSINDIAVTASQVGSGFVAGTAGSGTNLAGTYTWAITNVAKDGAESDLSSPSLGVGLGASAGTLTSIPLGDARTASRNVYRIGGTMNSFYLVGSIPDNIATTYYDNTTDLFAITEGVIAAGGVAGLAANTRFGSGIGRYPCYHLDRLFVAQGNILAWSQPLNPFGWPVTSFTAVGDGKAISGIISKWGSLIVIKPDSIWILSGTDESNFSLAKSESVVGTDQPFTICSIEAGVPFVNSQGLWLFNGAVSVKLTNKLDLLFRGQSRDGIGPIETINRSVTMNHCAVATADNFYLSVATLGSSVNNMLFIISLATGGITTRSIDFLAMGVDTTTGFVYGGLANGQIVQLDDYLATVDSQGPLQYAVQTKYSDLGNRGSNLEIWSFEFCGNTGGNVVTPTISYDNGNATETLAPFSTTTYTRVQRSFASGNSRKAQNVSITLNAPIAKGGIDLTTIKVYYDVLAGRARTGQ